MNGQTDNSAVAAARHTLSAVLVGVSLLLATGCGGYSEEPLQDEPVVSEEASTPEMSIPPEESGGEVQAAAVCCYAWCYDCQMYIPVAQDCNYWAAQYCSFYGCRGVANAEWIPC